MFVEFNIRRRPDMDEDNEYLNNIILSKISQIPNFWGDDKNFDALDLSEGEFVRCIHLSHPHNMLVDGLFGNINYAVRYPGHQHRDDANNDDMIILRIDTNKVEYDNFCKIILPKIVEIFRPYCVKVETNDKVSMEDWHIICDFFRKTGNNIDGRDGVYRIWPVAYYDNLLCQRAFKLSAAEVVERVAPECERAELINNGAFFIVTSEVVTDVEALEALNTRIRARLAA